jgi:peptidoglycan/LPS O-acetylase OafA/YrhL
MLEDPRWYRWLRALGSPIGIGISLITFIAAQLAYDPLHKSFPEIVIVHAMAATALLGGILTGTGPLQWLLATRPAVFVGRISYGMYLFHGLGISAGEKIAGKNTGRLELIVLAFVLSSLATILTAYVLARTIERPLIRVGRRWSDRILQKPVGDGERTTANGEERPARPWRIPFVGSRGA